MISVGVVMTVYLHMNQSRRYAGGSSYAQLDDVWVPQQLQILNLTLYPASHVSCHQPFPVYDLESNLLPADLMCCKLDFAKGALSQRLDNGVLPQALAGLGVSCLVRFDGWRREDRFSIVEVDGLGGACASPSRWRHAQRELL